MSRPEPVDQQFFDSITMLFAYPNKTYVERDSSGRVIIGSDDGEIEFAFELIDVRNLD